MQRIFVFQFSQRGSKFSSNRSILVHLVPCQHFCSQRRSTNVSLLLSRVLFCAIFAMFMFVLLVFFSVLTTLNEPQLLIVSKMCVINHYRLLETMSRPVGSFTEVDYFSSQENVRQRHPTD